jgi:hypothetical protein
MDCQSGCPLKGINLAYFIRLFQRSQRIRRALPRAVPQCGHGWKDARDENSNIRKNAVIAVWPTECYLVDTISVPKASGLRCH